MTKRASRTHPANLRLFEAMQQAGVLIIVHVSDRKPPRADGSSQTQQPNHNKQQEE